MTQINLLFIVVWIFFKVSISTCAALERDDESLRYMVHLWEERRAAATNFIAEADLIQTVKAGSERRTYIPYSQEDAPSQIVEKLPAHDIRFNGRNRWQMDFCTPQIKVEDWNLVLYFGDYSFLVHECVVGFNTRVGFSQQIYHPEPNYSRSFSRKAPYRCTRIQAISFANLHLEHLSHIAPLLLDHGIHVLQEFEANLTTDFHAKTSFLDSNIQCDRLDDDLVLVRYQDLNNKRSSYEFVANLAKRGAIERVIHRKDDHIWVELSITHREINGTWLAESWQEKRYDSKQHYITDVWDAKITRYERGVPANQLDFSLPEIKVGDDFYDITGPPPWKECTRTPVGDLECHDYVWYLERQRWLDLWRPRFYMGVLTAITLGLVWWGKQSVALSAHGD